jgi:hydroxymethylglutaryl-CoA lyase
MGASHLPGQRGHAIGLRDVTLRDGLQDEAPISLAAKMEIFEALLAAGVKDLELTSFVRADRVPAMADADEFARATSGTEATRWALVLNSRGAERALEASIRHLQFVVSVSDTHSRHNAGRPTAQAMEELEGIVSAAHEVGCVVELTLATAFGCPYEKEVDPGAVKHLAGAAHLMGVDGVNLADTIGVATPLEVEALVVSVSDAGIPVGVHLHDTRGLAMANAFWALRAGAVRIDASLGGLGGCPFAPGASGNLALEDLAHALEMMGMATGLSVPSLIDAAGVACRATDRRIESHVGVAGPRDQAPIRRRAGQDLTIRAQS